jgi:hypothetical protein
VVSGLEGVSEGTGGAASTAAARTRKLAEGEPARCTSTAGALRSGMWSRERRSLLGDWELDDSFADTGYSYIRG